MASRKRCSAVLLLALGASCSGAEGTSSVDGGIVEDGRAADVVAHDAGGGAPDAGVGADAVGNDSSGTGEAQLPAQDSGGRAGDTQLPVQDSGGVLHGKGIDAANTGPPAGIALSPVTGTVSITVAGTVWEAHDLTGSITVSADNVTIRNCRIRSNAYFAVRNTGGKNLVIERCEIFSPTGAYTGVAGGDFTMRRCNVHNFENGVIAGDNVLVEESYIHSLYYGPGAHVDGIEWAASGSNSTVRRNHIVLGGDTGCVNITPWGGGVAKNVLVEDNLLSGGTYSLYIRGDGGGTVSGVAVKGNVWVKGSYAYGTHSVVQVSGWTWSGNALDDGTPVPQ